MRPGCRWDPRYAAPLLALAVAGCSVPASDDLLGPDDEVLPPSLAWPMPGTAGADWVINNYVDLDPGPGLLDYRGGTKVYDGHRGVDIDVPNFRWMDGDFAILAAAPGIVTGLRDGEPDRNTVCVGEWNYVAVTHEDGSRAIYGHLKNGSIRVAVGQDIAAGDPLGVVGSSGCSTQPHLHFEIRDAGNAVVDPFEAGLWTDPPPYDPPLTFMDLNLKAGPITDVQELKDPPANVAVVAAGTTLGVGLSMAGGGPGDVVRATLSRPDASVEHDMSVVFGRAYRHTYWYWNRSVSDAPGTWTLTVFANDRASATYTFTVS